MRIFLTSRDSVSLSSAAAFFFLVPPPFLSVAEPGVGASDAPLAFFSLLANDVEAGVGAAGVDAPEAGVSPACCCGPGASCQPVLRFQRAPVPFGGGDVHWRGCRKWKTAKRHGSALSCRPCDAAPPRP